MNFGEKLTAKFRRKDSSHRLFPEIPISTKLSQSIFVTKKIMPDGYLLINICYLYCSFWHFFNLVSILNNCYISILNNFTVFAKSINIISIVIFIETICIIIIIISVFIRLSELRKFEICILSLCLILSTGFWLLNGREKEEFLLLNGCGRYDHIHILWRQTVLLMYRNSYILSYDIQFLELTE